ncbi:CDP-alcohol phosphatidyltransferase family protein [Brevibacterium luteolum]|uniref:CDP-alcohol phosphatidyltransferase family protein n=1 Tax=Brevibacterium luteolum TaxID=199591 RepID=UPI00223B3B6E|nr:CDP-alcohol phosphatidyltransferase family protein [Brevibacterium luteolum]MCT1873065.1 CDP-alcohol phosphatidyltransferase family protein [Brevibacterium luteolum]MCT1889405.1 CDP-alcohol phosphatidyltransferase family protein [Brevibacterium luteolum]MCT1892990.1 CDP-alcohol phosphatidyltransferase family protein [Brevibacterium luteolum]MCT1921920.1 CDP-alcohol phosphatidyltransferase family protein [Brevibacterium luteolum]MCT1923825.1 CDP-alcohol phosphatidyltransferase family protein
MQRLIVILILTVALGTAGWLATSAVPVILAAGTGILGAWPVLVPREPATASATGSGWHWADCVTSLRLGMLLVVIAAIAVHPGPGFGWLAVAIAIPMLALDLVDGLIARATVTTAAGARFDEQVDATVVLVLSAALVPLYGTWCLISGLAHFAFRAGAAIRPAWRAELPPSWRRKTVAAFQGPLLLAAGSPPGLAVPAFGWVCTIAAVASLLVSFALDIRVLERGRAAEGNQA